MGLRPNAVIDTPIGVVAICSALSGCSQKDNSSSVAEKPVAAVTDLVKQHEAKDAAIEAYIYAYPLVTMELTRRVSTNAAVSDGQKGPEGQFNKIRGYPPVDDHTVTAPNADTLYTVVWVDVTKEPWIIGVPDMKGRFFLSPTQTGRSIYKCRMSRRERTKNKTGCRLRRINSFSCCGCIGRKKPRHPFSMAPGRFRESKRLIDSDTTHVNQNQPISHATDISA